MKTENIITKTDSYKLTHWKQYPKNTDHVFSYFESRNGAKFPETVVFGLQGILKEELAGIQITKEKIDQAETRAKFHFGMDGIFNRQGWDTILKKYDGKLPLRIKAVPEGTPVPNSNVLMTVEDIAAPGEAPWLTNAVESLLTHFWYPSAVASLSRNTLKTIKLYLEKTSDTPLEFTLPFMLHDFGFRGTECTKSAERGGAGHLVNSLGTDTLVAMDYLEDYYNAKGDDLAFSVNATEHSVMTALGRDGEVDILERIIDEHPVGILSVVADSYNYYNHVEEFVCKKFKQNILARKPNANGLNFYVVRPDSITPLHSTPESLVAWTLNTLWNYYGGTTNSKGFKVLNTVRVLWGDGINPDGIEKIMITATQNGFSIENLVFGMGGSLLQRLDRDTQRSAFKSCAQCRDGVWYDVVKEPLDESKKSKAGRQKLILDANGVFKTVRQEEEGEDQLVTFFEMGEVINDNIYQIRKRASLL